MFRHYDYVLYLNIKNSVGVQLSFFVVLRCSVNYQLRFDKSLSKFKN